MKSSIEKAHGGAVNPKDPVHLIGLIVVGIMILGIIAFVFQQLGFVAGMVGVILLSLSMTFIELNKPVS